MLPTDAAHHDLRQLVERVDAQFHDIDARFAAVEARFAVLDDQLDRIGRHRT